MASHFSALGLLDPEHDLERICATDPVDVVVDAAGATHLRFADASGATIVAHVVDGDIACVTPFFAAPDPCLWHLRAGRVTADADCVHCSAVDADVYAAGRDGDAFTTRTALQLLHGRALAEDATGIVVPRAVVAFAHELLTFDDKDAYYRAAVDDKVRFAVPSFMPYGMFNDADDDAGQRATAQLVGRVLASSTRIHAITRQPFLHIVIDGICGAVDVVADAREVEAPEVGAVVEAHAWLVVDEREPRAE